MVADTVVLVGVVLVGGGAVVPVDDATEVVLPFDEPDEPDAHPAANATADTSNARRETVIGVGVPERSIAEQ